MMTVLIILLAFAAAANVIGAFTFMLPIKLVVAAVEGMKYPSVEQCKAAANKDFSNYMSMLQRTDGNNIS